MTITRDSLLTLEAYEKVRPDLRSEAMERKKKRKVFIGDNVMLQFEDEVTIRYQIQEMLRAEKTFDEAGIQDELEAYNPPLPEGNNWKATQMIEFTDVAVRQENSLSSKVLSDTLIFRSQVRSACTQLPMRTCPERTKRKPAQCTFCAFN